MHDPAHWYKGKVIEVHPHYRWVKVKEEATGQVFTLDPGYRTVNLELTVERNKNVRFTLDPKTSKLKEIEVVRDAARSE